MSFDLQHEIVNAWESAIRGDLSAVNDLGDMDAHALMDSGQDVIVTAATYGCDTTEQVVERLHRVGAHLQDIRFARDDMYDGEGFSPAQEAILDLSAALTSCEVIGEEFISIHVMTKAASVHLAGAIISAIAVASNESGLGVAAPLARARMIRAIYDIRAAQTNDHI